MMILVKPTVERARAANWLSLTVVLFWLRWSSGFPSVAVANCTAAAPIVLTTVTAITSDSASTALFICRPQPRPRASRTRRSLPRRAQLLTTNTFSDSGATNAERSRDTDRTDGTSPRTWQRHLSTPRRLEQRDPLSTSSRRRSAAGRGGGRSSYSGSSSACSQSRTAATLT